MHDQWRRGAQVAAAVAAVLALAACSGASGPPAPATFALPEAEAQTYRTAYIAEVLPVAESVDSFGRGEHVVLRNAAEIRIDMGGWVIRDATGQRLPLGIGRQIDPGTDLRVYSSCGDATAVAVFGCLDDDFLDDDGDVLHLLDAAGSEVAEFRYGYHAGR